MNSEIPGTQAVSRALRVLRLVAQGKSKGVSLMDISVGLSLSKPTVHRLLAVLMSEGLVEQDSETSRYLVGPECYALGRYASDRFGIIAAARDPVTRLAHESGDSAFFSIRRDIHVLCVQREDGSYPLKTHVLEAGSRHMLGAGAGSLAILCAMPCDYIENYLDEYGEELERSYEGMTLGLLKEQIRLAGINGYAVNEGFVVPGSWGIGVAVRLPNGEVGGAISIAAVEPRLNKVRQQELGQRLQAEALALEEKLKNLEMIKPEKKAAKGSKS